MMKVQRLTFWPALAIMLVLSSCAGPREAGRDEPAPPPEEEATRPPDRPAPERTAPPVKRTPTEHRVQGFRIQIFSSSEKVAANEEMEEALSWWRGLPASQRPDGLDRENNLVDLHWRAPYYRVRIGNFKTRAEADQALSLLVKSFPNAFIVPDTVTLFY